MPRAKKKPDLGHIADQLRPLAVEVSTLVEDPANARLHPTRNMEAITASLRRFGQRKPVVVRREGMIIEAGNGTLAAARAAGVTSPPSSSTTTRRRPPASPSPTTGPPSLPSGMTPRWRGCSGR